MWKSQFWLLANVANVQETTSLKGFVKMSRDHSLALAQSSTATCISLKTYIWPLGMLRSWAHSLWATFCTVCVCVCGRASQCQRVRPWQSGTSCACHWDCWAPRLPRKGWDDSRAARFQECAFMCLRVPGDHGVLKPARGSAHTTVHVEFYIPAQCLCPRNVLTNSSTLKSHITDQ